jgi:drug/metabolite transporter (DMT)-like permease
MLPEVTFHMTPAGLATSDRSNELRAYTLIVVASFIFASNHILARFMHGLAPPMGIVFWRMAIGVLVMLPIAGPGLWRNRHLVFEHWKLFVLMGALFVPLGNGVIYAAYNYTTALNGSVVATAQPAVTALLSFLLFRDMVSRRQTAGIAIAGIGVLIIIARGDPATLFALELNLGDILMLVSVCALALNSILIPRVPRAIGIFQMMLAVQFIGLLLTVPIYAAETIYVRPMPFDLTAIGVMLWLGIAVTVVALSMSNTAVRLVGANKASMLNYIRSALAAILAIVLLGETLYTFHAVALLLVIAGVYLMTQGPSTFGSARRR